MTGDWTLLHHPKSVRKCRVAFNRGFRSAIPAQTAEQCFPQRDIQKSTVFDLVYNYLRKCSDKDRKWKQRNCASIKFNRQHKRRKNSRRRDVLKLRTNFDDKIFGDNSKLPKSRADKIIPPKKISRSSSKECIADYMKAVRDGRKNAKLYVQEALLYGLQFGLLIPINGRKNVLRCIAKVEDFFI